jgi:hypothetical protein
MSTSTKFFSRKSAPWHCLNPSKGKNAKEFRRHRNARKPNRYLSDIEQTLERMLMLMPYFVKNEKKYKVKEPMPSKNVIAYMSYPHPSSSLQSSMTHLKGMYACVEER